LRLLSLVIRISIMLAQFIAGRMKCGGSQWRLIPDGNTS
jgi:hypothetical protein